jgi:predicted dehydrogenase
MGGSHILDLIGFFVGRPKRLYGSVYIPEGRDYDLRATALMETSCGVVNFEAVTHPLRHIGFLRDGWDERMEMTGTDGRLELYSSAWDQVETKACLLLHYDNRTGNVSEYRYDPVSPFAIADEYYVRHIEAGEQGEQSRLTGYDVDELITHIERSSELGQALDINWRL